MQQATDYIRTLETSRPGTPATVDECNAHRIDDESKKDQGKRGMQSDTHGGQRVQQGSDKRDPTLTQQRVSRSVSRRS